LLKTRGRTDQIGTRKKNNGTKIGTYRITGEKMKKRGDREQLFREGARNFKEGEREKKKPSD